MKFTIDKLAKSVVKKDTLEQCSNEELRQLVNNYPYFGAAHLLLAKKSLSENNEQANAYLQKASLFFNNPLWLEYLVSDTGNAEIITADPIIKNNETQSSIVEEVKYEPTIASGKKEEMFPEEIETLPDNAEETMEDDKEADHVELPEFKIMPIDPAKTELTFEPYHTIDYFASVGIKFKEEASPKDKFSKQLKSFTEWLKTLKKLPESAISTTIETSIEQKVEQMAVESLEDREVITESMADVWLKQGNVTKAIEIYKKLSLLDASKRPYFAAKIEELKKIN